MEANAAFRRPVVAVWLLIGSTLLWSASLWLAPRDHLVGRLFWDGLVFALPQLLAIAVLIGRAKLDAKLRVAWILFAIGIALNLLGDLTFNFHDYALEPFPVPAASDIAYLASYIFIAVGLVKMVIPVGRVRRGTGLDGLVMGLTTAAVLCAAWEPGLMALGSGTPQVAIGLLYDTLDLVLLATLMVGMMANGFRLSPALALLWACFLLWAVGNAMYLQQTLAGGYSYPSTLDITWQLGIMLMGLAALMPATDSASSHSQRWGSRIPVISALMAGAVLLFGLAASLPPLSLALAALALMAAVARQFLTMEELESARADQARARTDDLTGLMNRRGMYESLAARLAEPADLSALLIVDLDGFKDINDSLGHQAGDEMLVAVADRFRRNCPAGTDVARLGGDEFAIAVSGQTDPLTVANALLASIREPARIQDIAVRVQASVGVARYPRDARDCDEIIRAADVAMYLAKKDRCVVAEYRPELDPHSRDQLQLLAELRNAVPSGQLEVVYQPQCRLSDGVVCSVEALLRWQHPTRGVLMPAVFIEQAESSGVICDLTNFVLDRALSDLRSWLDAGVDLNLSVNISGVDLARLDLPDVVSRALERTDVEPERLTLELTETVMTSDAALAKRLVSRLQQRGVRISMDDFGIGFSSLSQALSLPLDEIKLDRSLTLAATEPKGRAILRTAVRLARAVGASVVAEGVEDLRTLNFLRSIGADYGQGYVISKPVCYEHVRGLANTVPAAMSASLAVVQKPRGGRAARHAAEGRPTGRDPGSQNETTGGADWPSGAW